MDVIEAILNRKSIRYFKPHTIPQEEVKLLLECARFAPSGGNSQPWEFLVVDDPAEIQQIYDFGWDIRGGGTNVCRFGNASLLIFFIGGAQCYLAAENISLAAYGLGYGHCMIGGFDRKKTKSLLGIPKAKKIPLFVVIGLADDQERTSEARYTATGEIVEEMLPQPPEARKPLGEIVYRGRYGNPYAELEPGRTRAKVVGGFK